MVPLVGLVESWDLGHDMQRPGFATEANGNTAFTIINLIMAFFGLVLGIAKGQSYQNQGDIVFTGAEFTDLRLAAIA